MLNGLVSKCYKLPLMVYILIFYLCDLFVERREREKKREREREREREVGREIGREGGREGGWESENARRMEGFFGKNYNSTNSKFNGGIFRFSYGCSVSKLMVNLAQKPLRSKIILEEERESARTKWRDFWEKKQNSRNSNFNGRIFHFSHGCSVSKLIVRIEENHFRGRKREREQNGGIFWKKKQNSRNSNFNGGIFHFSHGCSVS